MQAIAPAHPAPVALIGDQSKGALPSRLVASSWTRASAFCRRMDDVANAAVHAGAWPDYPEAMQGRAYRGDMR